MPATSHPEWIGRYRILELIVEGGMGSVYLAEQNEPVRRRVALKIIKLGMDTRDVVARFDAERQALAVMDHPNVARVLDAGATDQGRPYFVMEYVPGVSITEYCDRARLTTRQRLELFVHVCEAVQHAHQKGVIHRDLKPGNVLVEVPAGAVAGVPKVIDFGVAKATQHRLTEHTLFTERGQLIGTPEYMSPEQAEMTGLDIDTRSDIYSLGVLLYELLTGALPFDQQALRAKGYGEIQRVIREVEPPRPSSRLTGLGARADQIAQRRHTQVHSLVRELRQELEWIPLRAMHKNRTERYQTAIELAEDIRNYLDGLPLTAGPESAAYRARKFLRRNRGAVTAGAVVVIALVVGLVGMSVGMSHAASARDQARLDAQKARRTTDLLERILAYPKTEHGRDVTLREVFDAATSWVDEDLATEPEVRASILLVIARTYLGLGLPGPALKDLQTARRLGQQVHAEPGLFEASVLEAMSQAIEMAGPGKSERAESETCLRDAAAIRARILGEGDSLTLATKANLAGLQGTHGDRETEVQSWLTIVAKLLGQGASADQLYDLGMRTGKRAHELWLQGEHEQAKQLMRKLAEPLLHDPLFRRMAPRGAMGIALHYVDKGLAGAGRATLEASIDLAAELFGPEASETADVLARGAAVLDSIPARTEAVELSLRALAIERGLRKGNATLAPLVRATASRLAKVGRDADAIPLFQEALDRAKGEAPGVRVALRAEYATCLATLGRFEDAEREGKEAHRSSTDQDDQRAAARALVVVYEAWGKTDQAIEWRQYARPAAGETAPKNDRR